MIQRIGIAGLFVTITILGCRHKPVENLAEGRDTGGAERAATKGGPTGTGTSASGVSAASRPQYHGDRTIDPAGYSCDMKQVAGTCREFDADAGSVVRSGGAAVKARCEQVGGIYAVRTTARCTDGHIGKCTAPGGKIVLRYYADGPHSWTIAAAQENCLTLGVWSGP